MNITFKIYFAVLVSSNLLFKSGYSADIKYKVSDIPAGLITNSKAIVREKKLIFEISDINKAVLKVKYAITILNTNGISNSVFVQYYDKFTTVRKVQWELYDQNGIHIKNDANVKVDDFSANIGYSLYEDNRVKVVDPKCRITPFTVEYTYEISFNGLLSYPEWAVYDDYNVSVEKAFFEVTAPKGFKFRYLEKNLKEKCVISEAKDKVNYTWKFANMPEIKNEPFSTTFKEYTPVVYCAPSDFEIGGYNGKMESWVEFGKWINTLGSGRNILEKETTEKIRNLVAGIDNVYDKIKVLYAYMQRKVRYVSLQKGIGGWQTIDAETVDRVSYGDCKALSNYMKSLLDVIGIKSYYTLVGAGEFATPIHEDFPSNQFNHAILCVPVGNDTLWLECTNQTIPFGYIGTFSDDRKVLVTSDSGGILVRTKRYPGEENKQITNGVVSISTDGNATATVKTNYKGLLYDKVYPVLQMDKTDQTNFVISQIKIPSYSLVNYSYQEEKNIIPEIHEVSNLKLNNYGTLIGGKIIFKTNLMTRLERLPSRTKERKSEIIIRRPYIIVDTITFILPKGYKIEQLPERVILNSKFGEYSAEILSSDNAVSYIRKFSLSTGNYPVTDYSEFVDFFEKISLSDENKIALIKII